jgi:hypothetical protein
MYCGPSIEYQVTYSPASTTTNLITLPTSTVPSITFAQTTDTTDAKTYTVTVSARPVGAATWTSSATATYTYNIPCPTTNITTVPNSIENLVAFAGYTVNSLKKYSFNDTVSVTSTKATDSSDFCGDKLLKFFINGTETSIIKAKNTDFITLSPFKSTAIGVA